MRKFRDMVLELCRNTAFALVLLIATYGLICTLFGPPPWRMQPTPTFTCGGIDA